MNSDFGPLPSVLSGVAQPSTPHLGSNITPQPQQGSHLAPHPMHPQGHVYSLSGHVETQKGLGQDPPPNKPMPLRNGLQNGNKRTVQRLGKLKRLRLLPYQECHRARFLCLAKDAELLLQSIQARIKQE